MCVPLPAALKMPPIHIEPYRVFVATLAPVPLAEWEFFEYVDLLQHGDRMHLVRLVGNGWRIKHMRLV